MTTIDSNLNQVGELQKSGNRRLRRGNILVSVIGIALFVWVIVHSGPSVVAHQLKALRVALPLVIALSLIRLVLQTRTWSATLNNEGLGIPLRGLIGIRLASQAMGYLTIFGPVLSEPMKIKLLGTPVEKTATATFLDNGVYWFTSAMVGIAGCVSISLLKSHATISTLAFCGLFALFMLFIARRGSVLAAVTAALGKRSPSWLNKGAKIEAAIRKLRADRPQLVARIFWLDVVCQTLLVLEVAIVLWSLRLPFHLINLLAIEGLTRCVKMVTGFVPARLGADEGGAMSAFAASGLSPGLGLTLAFTRRARDLSWALVGLTWLAFKARASKQNHTSLNEGMMLCNS